MKLPLSFLVLLTILSANLKSQTLNLDFPSVNGQVYALASKGDTLFIGGDFIEVAEIPRANLAALDLNTGALLDWNPGADGKVDCIRIDENVLYACGDFQTINGIPRNTLAALDVNDATVNEWNPTFVFPGIPGMQTGRVSCLDISEGIIYIGGYFLSVNGQACENLVAMNTNGDLLSCGPQTNIPIKSVVIDDFTNTLFIGGPFSQIDGQERISFAAINLNTFTLQEWNAMADNPGNDDTVLFPQEDFVLVASLFTHIGGEDRFHVAKLNKDTGTAFPWQVDFINAFPRVSAFERWDDRIFLGGAFVINPNNPVGNLVAVDVETGAYAGWSADVLSGEVNTLLVAQNKLIAGGNFTQVDDENKIGLAVFDFEVVNATEPLTASEISVFPKPASEHLLIHLSTDQIDQIDLLDINGTLVKQLKTKGREEIVMNLDQAVEGIYVLVFRNQDHIVIHSELIPVLKRFF